MNQLDQSLAILDEFTSIPDDVDVIKNLTDQVADTLKAAFQRSTDSQKALELLACEDYSGEIPDWIHPNGYVEAGYLVAAEAFGETTYELTVPGRAFVRKALTDLHEANRQTQPEAVTS